MLEPPQFLDDLRRDIAEMRSELQEQRREIDLLRRQMAKVIPKSERVPGIADTAERVQREIRDLDGTVTAALVRTRELSNLDLRLGGVQSLLEHYGRRVQALERERRATQNEHDQRALLSARQLARRLGVSRSVVPRLIRDGLLRPVPGPGKHLRFAATEVAALAQFGLQRARMARRAASAKLRSGIQETATSGNASSGLPVRIEQEGSTSNRAVGPEPLESMLARMSRPGRPRRSPPA
jgi:excisionase family DNA binding protein